MVVRRGHKYATVPGWNRIYYSQFPLPPTLQTDVHMAGDMAAC